MADGIQLGRRYQCDVCGSMVLCTKAGDGMVECCDATMELSLIHISEPTRPY